MRLPLRTAAVVLGGALIAGAPSAATSQVSGGEVSLFRVKGVKLRDNMRELWADHVFWTREYIVAAVAGDPGATAAANRLMKNQEDIGKAMAVFYGDAAGKQLTTLLKEHITIAVDLVTAAKAGDNAKVASANKRWHDNAAAIAKFLAAANPNWSEQTLRTMLNEHLTLTTEEATARIQGRWADAVITFDKIFDQAMHMADALTAGIVKQFPNKV